MSFYGVWRIWRSRSVMFTPGIIGPDFQRYERGDFHSTTLERGRLANAYPGPVLGEMWSGPGNPPLDDRLTR
jgi:hypothetical protein